MIVLIFAILHTLLEDLANAKAGRSADHPVVRGE